MTEDTMKTKPEILAKRLNDAWENRSPVTPLSESEGLEAVEEAYAVQTAWSELRVSSSDEIVGRKIGLTSLAVQEQLGVNEPDYGSLWASRHFPVTNGRAELPADLFIAPRLEGEIAFLMGRPLVGPDVTLQEVLAATDALSVAVEVVDSRIEDWRIQLADTIADNASYGGFAVSPWSRTLRDEDLRTLGMVISQGAEIVETGVGAAALGHPARAVAWLANRLATFGISLEPGDIVLSGSIGRAVPAGQGDTFVVEVHGQPPLTVVFS